MGCRSWSSSPTSTRSTVATRSSRRAADEEARRARGRGTRRSFSSAVASTCSTTANQVLFGVDFEVEEGEIVALLGTNGAGQVDAPARDQREPGSVGRRDRPRRTRHHPHAAARDRPSRCRVTCPADAASSPDSRSRRTSRLPRGRRGRAEEGALLARRTNSSPSCANGDARSGGAPVRRRAADALAGAGVHVQAEAAHDRRAHARSRAGGRRRAHPCSSRRSTSAGRR